MKKYTFLFLLAAASVPAHAQWSKTNPVITTSPANVVDNMPVTITFHTHRGDMGLATYHQDSVYLHTGVTLKDSAPGSWNHVVTTWGTAPAAYKTTRTDDSTYTFTIPDLKAFYGITGNEVIDSANLLFRNPVGDKSGRDSMGATIYMKVTHVAAPNGVNTVTKNGFAVTVAPNPVMNNLMATFSNDRQVATSVRIMSVTGQTLISKDFGTMQKGTVSIAVDHLPAGIYMAVFRAGNAVLTQRIVKQ